MSKGNGSGFESTPRGQSMTIQRDREALVLQDKQRALKAKLTSEAFKKQLSEVAGKFMTPEAMTRLVLVATSRSPKLLECTPESVLRCLMDAAVLKVRPGGVMGRGYLIPRWNSKIGKNEACFDPGYRGLADIARRSGEIKRISSGAVHENDYFDYVMGTEERLTHKPRMDGPRGRLLCSYAVAEFKDGGTQVEVVLREDLDKIRNSSTSKGGPWSDWEDEMARKSAVRRLCKSLPYSDELETAVELATKTELSDVGDFVIDTDGVVVDDEPVAAQPRTMDDKLAEQLGKAKDPEPPQEPSMREPGDEP